MRKVLLVATGVFAAILAKTTPLAFLVFDTQLAQPGRLPDGWRIKVTRGTPDVDIINDSHGSVLHLRSRSSSFGLERGIDVDPAEYPFLTWKWKVKELPRGGDFRHIGTDDQAAQILLAFPDRHILNYIWDSTAPKDTMQSASAIPLVRIFAVVCRSGPAEINQWLSETRNVAEDYYKAYGQPPGHVKGIRLQINAQHTGSSAESYFGDIAFRRTP